MSDPIITVEKVSVAFGGLKALTEVSLTVRKGEILAVIGPNGAGKTTLFNAITGFARPDSGRVLLGDTSIIGLPPHEVARLGLVRTFQNLKPFAEMSVFENILIARERHYTTGLAAAILRFGNFRKDECAQADRVAELIDFVGLAKRSRTLARNLTYGELKLLEIARALAVEPQVLMLDEPVAGMNATETGFVMELVHKIVATGITVVLIEHDMKMVMGISERIYVLDYGVMIAEGLPEEIRANKKVIEAYLGGGKVA